MEIIILGPFTSGTNLIEKILNNYKIIHNEKIHWKHTINIDSLHDLCKIPNVLIIVMYRNIYNWLKSINRTKYFCEFTNFESNAYLLSYKHYNVKTKFDNIIDLYNKYYLNYIEILNNYKNVIYFNYEKIIFDNSLSYINNKLCKFNIIISNNMLDNALNKPSKNHGHCVKNNKEMCKMYHENSNEIKNVIDNLDVKKYINNDIIKYFELE